MEKAKMHNINLTRDGRNDLTNFEMDLHDTRLLSDVNQTDLSASTQTYKIVRKFKFLRSAFVPVMLLTLFVLIMVFFPISNETTKNYVKNGYCQNDCSFELVESIPFNLTYDEKAVKCKSTFQAWLDLMEETDVNLDVTAFYWTLTHTPQFNNDTDEDDGSWMGKKIYENLRELGRSKRLRIAQDIAMPSTTAESRDLANEGLAAVRSLNLSHWFSSGVVHTKLWVSDAANFYIGSANMDWRALSQVKELGIHVSNCTCLGVEVQKLFDSYWYMGAPGAIIPQHWPASFATTFNARNPMKVNMNSAPHLVYFSFSPPAFLPPGRESDIDAIVHTIGSARKFVNVAVMDYSPSMLFTIKKRYYAYFDVALRAAAYRGVHVRLLLSHWAHTKQQMYAFGRSLLAMNDAIPRFVNGSIEVKLFTVPIYTPEQQRIPFARVNHNKYMVTENTAYIGTSNWSGDYFTTTGGVAIVLRKASNEDSENNTVVEQLCQIFNRDWNSVYATNLS